MTEEVKRRQVTLSRLKTEIHELGDLLEKLSGKLKSLQEDVEHDLSLFTPPQSEIISAPHESGTGNTATRPEATEPVAQVVRGETNPQTIASEIGDPSQDKPTCHAKSCTALPYNHANEGSAVSPSPGDFLCRIHLKRFREMNPRSEERSWSWILREDLIL